MRLTLLAMVLSVVAGLAQAADSPLQSLQTDDQTRGWDAVGRVDIGDRAFCTGALIAFDLVLTAAHCLYDKESGRPFDAADFRFSAGLRNGRVAAERTVKRVFAHPSYVYRGPENVTGVPYDLALLQLDQPIQVASIRPYATGDDPQAGDTVEVVSYAIDRSEAPSLQKSCGVLGPQPGMMVFSCSVDFGSSGAPIFKLTNGVPQIVSVVSAKAELDGAKVSLGAQMAVPFAELMAAYNASQQPTRLAAGVRTSLPQIGASTVGAKFLKP